MLFFAMFSVFRLTFFGVLDDNAIQHSTNYISVTIKIINISGEPEIRAIFSIF